MEMRAFRCNLWINICNFQGTAFYSKSAKIEELNATQLQTYAIKAYNFKGNEIIQ